MKTVTSVLLLIFVSVCVVAGLGVWGLTLSREIKPIDLALLLVNLFIAVFLQYYLATRINDLRAEKNLLIDEIKDATSILKSLREDCEKPSLTLEERKRVLYSLRRLANALDGIETMLGSSQLVHVQEEFAAI